MTPISCRRCGATIKLVKMAATGRVMPVEAIPTPGGTVVARKIGDRWAAGYVLKAGEQPRAGFTVFRSHFIDCPPNQVKHTRGEAEQLF